MPPRGCIVAAVVALLVLIAGWAFLGGWYGSGPLAKDTPFVVPDGSNLTTVAGKLEREGAIGSAQGFLLRAKLLGASTPIKAGEFLLPGRASPSQIHSTACSYGTSLPASSGAGGVSSRRTSASARRTRSRIRSLLVT